MPKVYGTSLLYLDRPTPGPSLWSSWLGHQVFEFVTNWPRQVS